MQAQWRQFIFFARNIDSHASNVDIVNVHLRILKARLNIDVCGARLCFVYTLLGGMRSRRTTGNPHSNPHLMT